MGSSEILRASRVRDQHMNAQRKLLEAVYFVEQLQRPEVLADPEVFCFNFSAFLSASRSALNFVWNETGYGWFRRKFNKTEWGHAFAELRNANIHWDEVSFAVKETHNLNLRIKTPTLDATLYSISVPRSLTPENPAFIEVTKERRGDELVEVGRAYRLQVIGRPTRKRFLVAAEPDKRADAVFSQGIGSLWTDVDLIQTCIAYLLEANGIIEAGLTEGAITRKPMVTVEERLSKGRFSEIWKKHTNPENPDEFFYAMDLSDK